ncbi:MAG: hypothetical protein E7663_06360 [Ruminococcaceae bacterium]|nr:hypothetical protein [Oscillospiraceae bacterium]
MNEFSTYEYAVKQRIEGKWLVARIGLIFLYIAAGLSLLISGFVLKIILPLLALAPIAICLLIFVTWRYVSVEYEYSITSGILTFTKIFGGRSRKRVLEVTLKDAVRIAPLDNGEETAKAAVWHPEREFSAISTLRAPDIYFMLFEVEDRRNREKRRAVFYFEATARALQIIRFYNPSGTQAVRTHK